MIKYPKVLNNPSKFQVTLCPFEGRLKTKETEFIFDLNRFQDVIGLEILNLKLEAGKACLKQVEKNIDSMGSDLRYSYDGNMDAFYLQISDETSIDQISVLGELAFNGDGEIIRFSAVRKS